MTMIKRLIFTFVTIVVSISATARSMEQIWNSVPDSIIPYIDRNHRLEMTEFIAMGLKGDVDNMLSGKSIMDTITADYIHLTLSEAATMELKRLPYLEGDSLLCVVTTWCGPEKESDVKFYTQDWQPVDLPRAFDGRSFSDLASRLTHRPDTMSEARYLELSAIIDPVMIGATLCPETSELHISMAVPLLPSDQQEQVAAIMCETTLIWNGRIFGSR